MVAIAERYGTQRHTRGDSPFGYPDTRSYVVGMDQQGKGNYDIHGSYFRSGFRGLYRLEQHIKEISGLLQTAHLLLTNSGESAIAAALDVVSPSRGDIIIHGAVEYGKLHDLLQEDLPERGVISIPVNTGSLQAINKALHSATATNPGARVAAVLVESVGNGPGMPVVDIRGILSLPMMKHVGALIVDNTLPTEEAYPAFELASLYPDLSIMYVQSATKFALWNEDIGGMVYTANADIAEKLLKKRTRFGYTAGPSLVNTLAQQVPADREQYRFEVSRIMINTLALAQACAQAPGAGERYLVSHPNLTTHPNYDLVTELSPDGITPVFFIMPTAQSGKSAEELFYLLEDEGAVVPGEVLVTESFAFDTTAISYSKRLGGYVRVAGGLEEQDVVARRAEQFQRVLAMV